jgi:subtilisin family serine protease
MGQNDDPVQPTIPAYMAALSARTALMASDGQTVTIPSASTYVYSAADDNVIADFSGAGPTDVDFRVKPDVVAPGVNVLSSVPASACATPPCFAFLNGTSMATPHLAGSAAVVRGQHPDWSAADVRSAIVNTAVRGKVRDVKDVKIDDVNVVGAGVEDLKNAVGATVALDPVSVSFGAVPSGSGQSRTVNVSLRNLGNGSRTFALSVEKGSDASVAFVVNPAALTIAEGATATVAVTMTAGKGATLGGHQAHLQVSDGGGGEAHAALFTMVK